MDYKTQRNIYGWVTKQMYGAIAAVFEWFMSNMKDEEIEKEEYQIAYPNTDFELLMRRKK